MKKSLIYLIVLIFLLTLIFSMQSTLFDSFSLEKESDIFLEFNVDTSLQYNLFVIDAYNCEAFGAKFTLDYAITSIYKKDKKTPYDSKIFVSSYKDGGITTSEKEPVATFKPLEPIVYIRVRGTSLKSQGTFGLALLSAKNKKVAYKLSKSIFSEFHKVALEKNKLEEYKLKDGNAIKLTYNVEKGKAYKLTLVDAFNNNLFDTYFTLDGIWFHIFDDQGNLYSDAYSTTAEDGGITSLNSQYAAKFVANTQSISILVEPISLVYEGTFGIKLEDEQKIIKPKNIEETKPIGYESKISSSFEEEILQLDTLEIKDGLIIIKFNTQIDKTYYIYLGDAYNKELYEKDFTFKDLFFQIFDQDEKILKSCYASEISYNDEIGGITLLTGEPAASFTANSTSYTIKIRSFTGCLGGTFGIIIHDSDKQVIPYQILTK